MKRGLVVVLVTASVLLACHPIVPMTDKSSRPTTTPFPTQTPIPTLDPNTVVEIREYMALDAKVITVYDTNQPFLFLDEVNSGFYTEDKALLFRGDIVPEEYAQKLVAAAKKSGVLLRFGPPKSPCAGNDCTQEWGTYIEKGKEQEFWDAYHALEE